MAILWEEDSQSCFEISEDRQQIKHKITTKKPKLKSRDFVRKYTIEGYYVRKCIL